MADTLSDKPTLCGYPIVTTDRKPTMGSVTLCSFGPPPCYCCSRESRYVAGVRDEAGKEVTAWFCEACFAEAIS